MRSNYGSLKHPLKYCYGSIHSTNVVQAYDHERQAILEAQGYRVLRFTNEEVFQNLDSVLNRIQAHILRDT